MPWLSDLPHAVAARVRALLPEGEAGPRHELIARVEDHMRETAKAAAKNEFVDATLARTIAERLRAVLEAWASLSSTQRAAVHATVAYFALCDDEEDDLESVLGFEDDAQVANACFRLLRRRDLEIPLE